MTGPVWRLATSRFVLGGIALCVLVIDPGESRANGYLFFREKQTAPRPVYAGIVVDSRGLPVADAQVTIAMPLIAFSLVVSTDMLGRYHSTGIGDLADAAKARLAVSKPGYRLARTIPFSSSPTVDRPVITNFILARI